MFIYVYGVKNGLCTMENNSFALMALRTKLLHNLFLLGSCGHVPDLHEVQFAKVFPQLALLKLFMAQHVCF